MRKRALTMVFAVAMTLASAQVARASVEGTVSIGYDQTTRSFHGKVASANSECVAHRTVRVFKQTANGRQLQGRVTSNASGGWRLEVMHAQGRYFAVAAKQTIMTTSCARAKSRIEDVM